MEIVERLRLFNDVVEVLERRDFVRDPENRKVGAVAEWKEGEGWESIFVGPSEESRFAAATVARQFVQKKDRVSFRQMGTLYQDSTVSPEFKERFEKIRRELNTILDSATQIGIEEGRNLTHSDVFDLFVNGEIAHPEPNKKQVLLDLRSTPFYPILEADFSLTLHSIIEAAREVRGLNLELLEHLRDSCGA